MPPPSAESEPLENGKLRCPKTLQEYLESKEINLAEDPGYWEDFTRDFRSVSALISCASKEEIWEKLWAIGSTMERKYIALRLLLFDKGLLNLNPKLKDNVNRNEQCSTRNECLGTDSNKEEGIVDLEMADSQHSSSSDSTITYYRSSEEFIDYSQQKVVLRKEDQQPETSNSKNKSHALDAKNTTQATMMRKSLPVSVEKENQLPNLNDGFTLDDASTLRAGCSFWECSAETSKKPKVVSEKRTPVDEELFQKLTCVFPEACPDYVRSLCRGKKFSADTFNDITDLILEGDYPKRQAREASPDPELDLETQFHLIEEVLPDADPVYLKSMLYSFAGDQDSIKDFVDNCLAKRTYPSKSEYLRKQQLSSQKKQYTTDFSVENFVQLFSDPVAYFEDASRRSTMVDMRDRMLVNHYFRNNFRRLSLRAIEMAMKSQSNIYSMFTTLEREMQQGKVMKTIRPVARQLNLEDIQNIPLLQELAYFTNKEAIVGYLEDRKLARETRRLQAKAADQLQTCGCCFDDEIMLDDVYRCASGCGFCVACVKKAAEIAYGDGKTRFPCLGDCGAEFALQTLQDALPPKMFSKIAQKRALAEVTAAGLEGLETCPFCQDFAYIPPPGDKHFQCKNSDCMKESCRQCKEMAHVPYKCSEVEKDEAVKARTYIEDKMTEALVRECWKCHSKFIKEEGCNKMTCYCGAAMCYICRKPVKNYEHFNGQGGSRTDLCPLYTDNYTVNERNVLIAAEKAKSSVDPAVLMHDPTADLAVHMKRKRKHSTHGQGRMIVVGNERLFLQAYRNGFAIGNPGDAPR